MSGSAADSHIVERKFDESKERDKYEDEKKKQGNRDENGIVQNVVEVICARF